MSFPANVRIVLVEPETAGNVGAAARAMQTMGLADLVVVNPVCNPQDEQASCLAHSAVDILERLRIVPDLGTALAETTFSIATTRRRRRQGFPVFTPEEAADQCYQRGFEAPMAIVFGRESSGLTNPELSLCSVQSTIPAATRTRSLNLAQSVMLYCYALFQRSLKPTERSFPWQQATHAEMERFYRRLEEAFERSGMKPSSTLENYVARYRRVFGRVPLESRDIHLLHRVFKLGENVGLEKGG